MNHLQYAYSGILAFYEGAEDQSNWEDDDFYVNPEDEEPYIPEPFNLTTKTGRFKREPK